MLGANGAADVKVDLIQFKAHRTKKNIAFKEQVDVAARNTPFGQTESHTFNKLDAFCGCSPLPAQDEDRSGSTGSQQVLKPLLRQTIFTFSTSLFVEGQRSHVQAASVTLLFQPHEHVIR